MPDWDQRPTCWFLSRADEISVTGRDVREVAAEFAKGLSDAHRLSLARVLPVFGLLAESAAAKLTDTHAKNLQKLKSVDQSTIRRALRGSISDDFPLPREDWEELVRLLAPYGIDYSRKMISNGADGLEPIATGLEHLSGIAEVKELLNADLTARGDVLRARSVIRRLEAIAETLATNASSREFLSFRVLLDDLRADPAVHPVTELEVFHDCRSGRVQLPSLLHDDLNRLYRDELNSGSIDVSNAGLESIDTDFATAYWRTFLASGVSLDQQRVARVVLRSYLLRRNST